MTDFFRTSSEALPTLARFIMTEGTELASRNGDRVQEITHQHVVLLKPWLREIVTPGRKASLPAQIAETMWVLAGRNDIEWLSEYLPRAADFSDDGKVWRGGYGPRIRRWSIGHDDVIDQLAYVVELLRAEPTTRRAVINIYDPAVDSQPGKDIPCNNWLHFMNRGGKLDLHVVTRSNDLIWGWSGINAFEWSALQEIVATLLGVGVGELHFSISSLHIYDKHWGKARRVVKESENWIDGYDDGPRFGEVLDKKSSIDAFDDLLDMWFDVEHLIRYTKNWALRNTDVRDRIDNFPEPMLRSWLRVLAWHWSGDVAFLAPLAGTRVYEAALASPRRVKPEPEPERPLQDGFAAYVSELHETKHRAYGDSWKRRGEQIGILANIARKVDRLGVSDDVETSADTAIDLLVYLIKYRLWLTDLVQSVTVPPALGRTGLPVGELSDHHRYVTKMLHSLPHTTTSPAAAIPGDETIISEIRSVFDDLEHNIGVTTPRGRAASTDKMIGLANTLARRLWLAEKRSKLQWGAGNALEGED